MVVVLGVANLACDLRDMRESDGGMREELTARVKLGQAGVPPIGGRTGFRSSVSSQPSRVLIGLDILLTTLSPGFGRGFFWPLGNHAEHGYDCHFFCLLGLSAKNILPHL